jgi:hypothetical protein
MNSCPKLTNLSLHEIESFTNDSVNFLSEGTCERMRSFAIGNFRTYNTQFTGKGLQLLGDKFHNLTSLHVDNVDFLNGFEQADFLYFIKHNPNLTELHLNPVLSGSPPYNKVIPFTDELLLCIIDNIPQMKEFKICQTLQSIFSLDVVLQLTSKLQFVDVITLRLYHGDEVHRFDFNFNKTERRLSFDNMHVSEISTILNCIKCSFTRLDFTSIIGEDEQLLTNTITACCPDLEYIAFLDCVEDWRQLHHLN